MIMLQQLLIHIYCFADNLVEENVEGIGDYGGWCACPDGNSYQVGATGDNCESPACINGIMVNCFKRHGAWSGRKVICDYEKHIDPSTLSMHISY